ncbi:autotransporter adhesin BigA [Salmonella enterica]|nr:autotransporter adhesin BigA [Salmonella enterica]
MKKKKLLAVAVTIALQTYYVPAMAAEKNEDDRECPTNISLLSEEERSHLSAKCLAGLSEQDNHWGWVTGGVAALIAGVAIGVENNGGGHHHYPDTKPLPPDDVTPTPPDDSDDGKDTSVITFSNAVTIDKGENKLLFDDIKLDRGEHLGAAELSYNQENDQWQLVTKDGKTLDVSGWNVTELNAAIIEGTYANGLYWKYDSKGYLILADDKTQVATGDGETHSTDRDMDISGKDRTGAIISGNNTTNTLNGDSSVSDGAIGMVVTGDGTTNNIAGQTTVDGAIGALISGDGSDTHFSGGINVTGGGTGMVIDGNDSKIDNAGTSEISGAGSTGSIIYGNDAQITNDGQMTVKDGGTGGKIIGDGATIDNKGNSDISGTGSTALIVEGDNTTIINEGTQNIADNATGIYVKGDDTQASMTGDITISGGGTAMVIEGDNANVDITGKSDISGENSTDTVIDGNKARINNEGELNVAAGGTGAIINGGNAIVDNKGHVTADGTGSTALIINGDDALIISEGDQTITNGATGTEISGDNTRIANTGDITVDGAGSSAVTIDGSNSQLAQAGDLLVTGGAKGIVIQGDHSTVYNAGKTTVRDSDSVGFIISNDYTKFSNIGEINVSDSATGISLNGDNADIDLSGVLNVGDFSTGLSITGNNNDVLQKDGDVSVTGQKATGISITGQDNTVNISGNIVVDKDQTAENAADYFYTPSVGLDIAGNNNNVTLDGSLTVMVDTELASRTFAKIDGSQETIKGLYIHGDGNNVTLNGGINYIGEENAMGDAGKGIAGGRTSSSGNASAVSIDGNSSLTLHGDSYITGNFGVGIESMIQAHNGAHVELADDATIDTTGIESLDTYYTRRANGRGVMLTDSGATLVNNGHTISNDISFFTVKDANSTLINNGSVDISRTSKFAMYGNVPTAVIATDGGSAINNGVITAHVDNQGSVVGEKDYFGYIDYDAPFFNPYAMGVQGMAAVDKDTLLQNDTQGQINILGRGTGMVANLHSTALNKGTITIDPLWKNPDDTTSYGGHVRTSLPVDYGVGMGAGAIYRGMGGTAINQGTITVYNAGVGMAAAGANSLVVNQGVINLEQNENYDSTVASGMLVGMGAYQGGIAINDTSGIININAADGMAFYADKDSRVVNYGTICITGDCQSSDEYNPTDDYVMGVYKDGLISAAGETVILDKKTYVEGLVGNDGTVTINNGLIVNGKTSQLSNNASGVMKGNITLESGTLVNEGEITGMVTSQTGSIDNKGKITKLDAESTSTVTNSGQVTDTLTIGGGSSVTNSATGSVNYVDFWKGSLLNQGDISSIKMQNDKGIVNNEGTIDKITFSGASVLNNTGTVNFIDMKSSGTVNNAGVVNNGAVDKNSTFNNLEGGTVTLQKDGLWSGKFNNWGTVNGDADIATSGSGHTLYNGSTGVINGQITTSKNNGGSKAINDGTINIDKTGNVAMSAHGSAKMVNNGTINVGTEGTTQTGMIGMQLESDAKADGVIENNGTINIYANNSYAFSQLGSNGHIVNNGTVVIADGVTGSGFIKQNGKTIEGSGEYGNGSETHYVNFTAPTEPVLTSGMPAATADTDSESASSATNNLAGYVVGTNVDGSAGKLKVNNASLNGVEINTGFTAGSADTTVTFDNVVEGNNLTDASAITSTSVVWNAQGSTDADGNVDVTMSKNAYVDVATDGSVNGVAQALDAGYTNNELYTSLNVGTTAELNSALKQVSGSQATTVFREARIMSNRFTMLADAAPQVNANGLAFNVVAKGDPRAELGNDTQYDMLALRQKLDLTTSQNLTLEYGIARLDGSGSQKAGDNGLTDGFSQFFGLKHSTAFDDDLVWNNSLRYDVHNLDSSRSISYSDTNKTADSNARQQYMEFRSEGAKTFTLMDNALKVTPYAGVKFRHTLEDGYKERSAGDFNLSMNAGSETAVDSIVGLKLDYAGDNGWSATATLEGGPNLSYSKSQRTASLQGAAGQSFSVDDGQKGGGVNGLATVGVKYSSKDTALHLDAYQWKEDGISDKGFMLNVKKTFR